MWAREDEQDGRVRARIFLVRIGIYEDEIGGWSWGGYLTALAVTQTDRFKAAVMGAGVSNLTSDNSLGDIPSVNLCHFGETVYHDSDPYYERSPIRHVSNT